MARELIDRNKITYMWQEFRKGEFSDGVTLQSIIHRMPTIDAVEVVRCRDCKHWFKSKEFSPFGWCCQRNDLVHVSYRDRMEPEDFCSKGERRDND